MTSSYIKEYDGMKSKPFYLLKRFLEWLSFKKVDVCKKFLSIVLSKTNNLT
ncbi:MAG: hypothetical protein WD607_04755 [Candidatus Paceibacterota bacterium]